MSGLKLTTSSEEVLITGQRNNAVDPSALAQVPPELVAGLERRRLHLVVRLLEHSRRGPTGHRTVQDVGDSTGADRNHVGDPAPLRQPDHLGGTTRHFLGMECRRDLRRRLRVECNDGYVMFSPDGRSWERTDRFPPLFYQNWGRSPHRPRLLLDSQPGCLRRRSEPQRSSFPPRSAAASTGVFVTPGSLRPRDDPRKLRRRHRPSRSPESTGTSWLWTTDCSASTSHRARPATRNFDSDGLIAGTYLPETDSIRFDNSDGSKTFEFPLSVFLDLQTERRHGAVSMSSCPSDGLDMGPGPDRSAMPRTPTSLVVPVETFLVALHNYGRDYRRAADNRLSHGSDRLT